MSRRVSDKVLIESMCAVYRATDNPTIQDFAISILRQSSRDGWKPTKNQRAYMLSLMRQTKDADEEVIDTTRH